MTTVTAHSVHTLPFVIGGAGQRHAAGVDGDTNSQDAFGIHIDSELLMGVVCDGCGGAHKLTESRQGCSTNEVGARLLVYAVISSAIEVITTRKCFWGRTVQFVPSLFLGRLEKALLDKLSKTVSKYCGKNDELAERFIFDCLMSTVLGIAVHRDQYLVFGCGDGFFGVNGNVFCLDDQAGTYLANELLLRRWPERYSKGAGNEAICLRTLATGSADALNGAFVATDGFGDIHRADPLFLPDLLKSPPDAKSPGYDKPFVRNLRSRFQKIAATGTLFNDDATIVMARRSV